MSQSVLNCRNAVQTAKYRDRFLVFDAASDKTDLSFHPFFTVGKTPFLLPPPLQQRGKKESGNGCHLRLASFQSEKSRFVASDYSFCERFVVRMEDGICSLALSVAIP